MGGWTVVEPQSYVRKAVIIGAPHTSNWDGYWALVYMVATGLRVKFFIKKSLFWFPLNVLLHGLGGIPLDRGKAGRAVHEAVALINDSEEIYFGLAPEGTRSHKPGWKSGFYRIAEDAGVPLLLAFFDYKNKRLGVGPMLTLTGDQDADLAIIRSYYESSSAARWPEKTSPIEFITRNKRA